MRIIKVVLASVGVAVLFVGLLITMHKNVEKAEDTVVLLEEVGRAYLELKKECGRLKKKCNRLLKKQKQKKKVKKNKKKSELILWERRLKRREEELQEREKNWKNLLAGDVFEIYYRLFQEFEEWRRESELKKSRWHQGITGRCNAVRERLQKFEGKKL